MKLIYEIRMLFAYILLNWVLHIMPDCTEKGIFALAVVRMIKTDPKFRSKEEPDEHSPESYFG